MRREVDQPVEIGMAGTEIVERVLHAQFAEHGHGLPEALRVLDGRLLRDLDHYPIRCDAVRHQCPHGTPAVGQQVAQRHGAEVEEQLAAQAIRKASGQPRARRLQLQLDGLGLVAGQVEQGIRHGQRRIGRPPDQRLVAQHLAGAEHHDRLEDGVERRQA